MLERLHRYSEHPALPTRRQETIRQYRCLGNLDAFLQRSRRLEALVLQPYTLIGLVRRLRALFYAHLRGAENLAY